jgi:hypothetical protein
VEISAYVRECLREDEEFILDRGRATGAELPSVLFLTLASKRPALESLKEIKHESSLSDELDSAWAVQPLALSQQHGQMTRFLRLAVGIATAFGWYTKGS